MGNAAGVAKQAVASTKFMIKAVASAMKSKKKKKRGTLDARSIIRNKLINHATRNARDSNENGDTDADDGDMLVETLSKGTGTPIHVVCSVVCVVCVCCVLCVCVCVYLTCTHTCGVWCVVWVCGCVLRGCVVCRCVLCVATFLVPFAVHCCVQLMMLSATSFAVRLRDFFMLPSPNVSLW